jgi:hypothetical protein
MGQLAEPLGVGIAAGRKECKHSAELKGRIDCRSRMAGIVEVACTADADIAVVVAPEHVEQSMLVDHLGCDHIDRRLGIACLASRLAFLLISTEILQLQGDLRCLVCFSSAFRCSFPPTAYACSYST